MISFFFWQGKFCIPATTKKGVANGYKDFLWEKWAHVTTAMSRQKVLACHQHVAGTLNFSLFLSYPEPNLAKPSFGWSPTHLPQEFGKKEHR
jgi:hypothetical protein